MASTSDSRRLGNVRERRMALGLTTQELAQFAGVSVDYTRHLDHGYTPRPDRSPQYRAVLRALEREERRTAKEVKPPAAA